MQIKDLDYYVKFVFQVKDKEDNFVTSDITALKDFVINTDFKIGDSLVVMDQNYLISNIFIKHVNEEIRSNKYGFNLNEGGMKGFPKDSLITIVIEVLEQL